MRDALRWIGDRSPAPPEGLLARMREALEATAPTGGEGASIRVTGASDLAHGAGAADGLPEFGGEGEVALARQFGAAAVDRLRRVMSDPGDRASALDLLAADALLTYAFEAAAEAGPDAVATVAGEFGPRRLAQLLSSGGR